MGKDPRGAPSGTGCRGPDLVVVATVAGYGQTVPSANWGLEQPPHEMAPSNGRQLSDVAEELPEIQQLLAQGWHLLPEAPMWVFLPAVWPVHARTWVPDRSTHYVEEWENGQRTGRRAWTEVIRDGIERDANADLRRAGLPPRPANRLWLVRLPDGFTTLDDLLYELIAAAEQRGVEPRATPEFASAVQDRLRQLIKAE